MMKYKSHSWIGVYALTIALLVVHRVEATALDDYVAKADLNYGYSLEATRVGPGYTVYAFDLTSQQWRSAAEVDRTLWQHELLLAVPWSLHGGSEHTAILVVNGGSNKAGSSSNNDDALGLIAGAVGTVVAMVSQVPNQPLLFADQAAARAEDAILAYGMDKYLLTGDPEWLAQLPMTKAVVRAMDSIQDFAANPGDVWPQPPRIDNFIVAGGSKRGWATWLTAAVESGAGGAARIKAILPASIDLLNLGEQFEHHWDAYGFYTTAIQDYVAFDLPCRSQTPEGRTLVGIIDPYAYRDRLTMCKLVVNSAGDQFFLPDSSQFYFQDLPGPKLLRYTLNTDHSQGQDLETIIRPTLSWLIDLLEDDADPGFSWSLQPDGSIRVETQTPPEAVRLWQATNPNARDFRLETIGEAWYSTPLADSGGGVYIGQVPPPPQGWTAFTVELTYPGSPLIPDLLETKRIYTTDVQITPPELPFAGTGCPDFQPPRLQAAVLPYARAIALGQPATAFASVINQGNVSGLDCGLALPAGIDAAFTYQTTDASNLLTGMPDTPVKISAGATQGFVFGITPNGPLTGVEIAPRFDCANSEPALVYSGVNTLILSALAVTPPDLLAIGVTPSLDGVVRLPSPTGTGFFAAAAINLGSAGTITVSADDGGLGLPLSLVLCETTASGNWLACGSSLTRTVGTGQTVYYSVFLTATGQPIAFDPSINRLFLRFRAGDMTVGATNVAVATP